MQSAERFVKEKSALENAYIKVVQLHPQAEIPTKEADDVGWTVTLVGRTDNRAEDDFGEMNGFSTGLQLCPPKGYYLEVVALPSFYKHGYNLASGTLIIGPDNRDELIIPFMKFRECNDLELPIEAVQVIVKKYAPSFMLKTKVPQIADASYGQYASSSSSFQPPPNGAFRGDMEQYQAFSRTKQGSKPSAASGARQNHMF